MNIPHKYAHAIIAWANGEVVQFKYAQGTWNDYTTLGTPAFDMTGLEWRIKPAPIEVWVNIYRDRDRTYFCKDTHKTKAIADLCAASGRTACVKMSFVEGEGLSNAS